MSKLADAMRRAARREARPIGFTAAATARNPTMLVLARTTTAGAAEAAAQGADAVITTDGALPNKGVSGALWGSEALVKGRGDTKALREAGASFLVFDADTTNAAALLEEDLGYVMRIDLEATDTFLRTVDSLSLDALLVPSLEGTLTVRRTLDLRRISSFARKMLILGVAGDTDPVELEALRDCGVIGVVVEDVAGVEALRAKVDALPPRSRAGDGRGVNVALRATGDNYHVEEMPREPEEE